MTAPSLLDELEGVVRLAEKATPGPWRWSENGNILGHMPNGYDEEREVGAIYTERDDDKAPVNAEAIIAAMHFIRTHHAEIAAMAKRLEAAERDARVTKKSAETLCRIYFEIAAEAVGEDQVRAERDRRIDAATQEGEG